MKPVAGNVLIAPAAGAGDENTAVQFGGADVGVGSGRVTEGGVHLPSAAQQVQSKPSEGIVRAIGDDVTLKIAEGDRVLYRSWTGLEIRLRSPGEEAWFDHQITPQRDVLAVIDEGEEVEVIVRPLASPAQQQRRAG